VRSGRRPVLAGVSLATLAVCGAVTARADVAHADIPASAMQRCAIIADVTRRVACYDALADLQAAPSVAAPLPTPAPIPTAAPPPAASPPAASPPAASPPKDAFGLTTVQRAAPEQVQSIDARVVGFGRSSNDRPTVQLDNGQLWELDAADPLLAAAEPVTIRRGALGSFLMTTPAHHTHRVRRLR
jgi:hypothetical protein